MKDQYDIFIRLLKAFEENHVDYILIGGLAMNLHGFTRMTLDVDVVIKMISENIDKIRNALSTIYNDNTIEEITLKELDSYSVIRYGTPDGFYLDIIGALGETFEFSNIEYEILELDGIPIKVASPEMLYQMKKNTYRLKDNADLQYLETLIDKKTRKK